MMQINEVWNKYSNFFRAEMCLHKFSQKLDQNIEQNVRSNSFLDDFGLQQWFWNKPLKTHLETLKNVTN